MRTDASLSLDSTRARDAVEFVTSSRPAVVVAVAVGGDDDVRGRGSRGAGCHRNARVSGVFRFLNARVPCKPTAGEVRRSAVGDREDDDGGGGGVAIAGGLWDDDDEVGAGDERLGGVGSKRREIQRSRRAREVCSVDGEREFDAGGGLEEV